MNKLIFSLLLTLGLSAPPLAYGQADKSPVQAQKPASSLSTPASMAAPTPAIDSGPMPFSNEEANFYRRAWPIDKSHSAWALVLYGAVLLVLAALIIRAMAKSGPRKPPQQ